MLEILSNLFKDLHINSVPFCNWKGHSMSDEHLMGIGDLDLFVPISKKNEFNMIVRNHEYKKVYSFQANHEFVDHYLGLDKKTQKFSHLHVYFKIVTGEHASKNYILPLENIILKNLDNSRVLPSPDTKLKNVIYMIRFYLKFSSIYGLLQYYREKKKHEDEWAYLEKISNYDDIKELGLSSEFLEKLQKVFMHSSIITKIFYSIKLKFYFKNFRRRSFFRHFLYSYQNLLLRILNKYLLHRKKLFKTGVVISVCGLDGSGKSSIIKALGDKFSKNFTIKTLHLGRPSSNILTFIPNLFIRAYSFFKMLNSSRNPIFKKTARNNNISIIFAIRSVLLAYDRKVETKKALKFSKKGFIVLCDRYPGIEIGKMDSPRILEDKGRGYLYNLCYKIEQKIYHSIVPAEIILHLKIPLEKAIERNNKRVKLGKETESELRERYKINSQVLFKGNKYLHVDASYTFEEVLSEISNEIWSFIISTK